MTNKLSKMVKSHKFHASGVVLLEHDWLLVVEASKEIEELRAENKEACDIVSDLMEECDRLRSLLIAANVCGIDE